MSSRFLVRPRAGSHDALGRPVDVDIQPPDAGWRFLAFSARAVTPDAPLRGTTGTREALVVTLSGGLRVEADGATYVLEGRASVFDGLPWALYLPRESRYAIAPLRERSTLAIGMAEARRRTEPRLVTPDDVMTEIRGAGNATRQINHLIRPDFPADRLLAVEVYTPAGGWSSYPPHKHDEHDPPREAILEEIYFYQVARPEGFGIQRLYRRDGSLDEAVAVRHGDLFLVPYGYHPFVAGHGFDCYYFNALACEGDWRTMAAAFDPDLDWTRVAWEGMAPDPRLPMVRRREAAA